MASFYETCNRVSRATSDDTSSRFGPEASAKLNEVLENVNRLIESLNCVTDDVKENDVMSARDDCATANKLKQCSYLGNGDPFSFEIDKSEWESNGTDEVHLHTESNEVDFKSRSADVNVDKELISELNGPLHYGCRDSTNNAGNIDMNYLVNNVHPNITKEKCFPNSSLNNGTRITSFDKLLPTDRVKTCTCMTNDGKYEGNDNECWINSDGNNQQTGRQFKQTLSSSQLAGKVPEENKKGLEKPVGFINKNCSDSDSHFKENSIAVDDSVRHDKDIEASADIDISEDTNNLNELPSLVRSSPTLVRKDRKDLEERGLLRKSSNEEWSEKSTLVTKSKENNISKTIKKSSKAIDVSSTFPHRSLSLKKVISRKFGGSRRERRKLVTTKSLPSETKADCRKFSDLDTQNTLDHLHDRHPLLGCFHGNEELKESESIHHIKEQLTARSNSEKVHTNTNIDTTKPLTLPRQQNTTFTPSPKVRRAQSVEERPKSIHLTKHISEELESADSANSTPVLRLRNKHLGGGKLNRFFHSFRHKQDIQQEDSFEEDSEDISKSTTVDRMRYHLQKGSLMPKQDEMKSRYSSGSADSYSEKRHSDGYKHSMRKDIFHSDPGNSNMTYSAYTRSSGSRVKSMPSKGKS